MARPTEDVHLAGWFPTTIEGRRARRTPALLVPRAEGEPFDGEMRAFDPPSLMELRWGDDVVRFEVAPDGAGSVLVLTVTFPEQGKAARDGRDGTSASIGWRTCARDDLPWEPPERWRVVHRATSSGWGRRRRPSGRPAGASARLDAVAG